MRVEINGDNYEVNDDVRKYLNKKITKLGRHMNKHHKKSAHVIARLKEQGTESAKKFECEIIMRIPPKEEIVAKEATVNMFAAIDIVEAKLDAQLRKVKNKLDNKHVDRKGVFARMRRRADRDFRGSQN